MCLSADWKGRLRVLVLLASVISTRLSRDNLGTSSCNKEMLRFIKIADF
jgi:hypothetical protein